MERSAPGPSVPPSRDDVALQDLFDTCYGLGDHHQVEGKSKYLYRQRDECLTSLQDLETAVAQDTGIVRAKLGEWQVLPRKIVPLLTSYIEDSELASHVLKLMVLLTTRVGNYGPPPVDHRMLQEQEREQLCHLQEYKEAFTNSAVFTMLVRLLVEALDGEGRTHLFKDVLFLLRNLVSVPDPGPGDTGFTPLRRRMQMTFLRNFCEEGVLAFLSLIANELTAQQQEDTQQVWALADILYHVCTHFDPEELLTSRKNQGKPRSDLAELLARDKADQKLLAPQSSRHSRFGTLMHTMSSDGSMMLSSSVMQNSIIQKSSALLKREFRNPEVSGKKTNMFHNLFFVDLGEGSVREYNQINPHVRGVLDDRMYHPQKVLQGYRAFFEQLCSTSFSSLVSIMRSSCNANPAKEGAAGTEFDMPHLLNFVSWFLEFHRVQHATQVEEAKKKSSPPPDMDIAVIQGAIDLDMIQFTTARLRDFGKGAHIHSSFLVVVLRALSAQVQTIKVITECTGSDTRDCGDLLVTHTVKEDVLGNVSWIMKNFNSATHDPRILSYSVEVWHLLTMLMERRGGERGAEAEFQVERLRGVQMSRSTTSVEKEIAGLADSRVVENLFHLLEKYRRHTPLLQSMLVKLIRSIMDAQPTNIVLFFELSYFMRIQRIMTDPLLTSNKNAEKYKDILGLLRFVLREFFTCAETNKCVFAELLFRKVQESQKEQVESCAVEFGAILSNYENEGYRQVLDRMSAGDTVKTIRKQRADVMKGQGWTEEEDAVLRQRYAMYASHPLAADLLAADLPEDNKRTPLQVRRRLIELELMPARGPGGRAAAAEDEPASKKAKVDSGNVDMPAGKAAGNGSHAGWNIHCPERASCVRQARAAHFFQHTCWH
ncbi:Timeless [Symbiodinium natans]|uniref:Timeless protein n=1 Tax=Symbiodinium natans TaxID=878477 RepID=A0A812JWN7_9DINO|nr:Timeless [Symbiodinium natans]